MEDLVEYCANCQRHIAAANYMIHSVHCERNIKLCEQCKEPVPRSEIEKHWEENHTLEACSYCSTPTEKWLIENHKSSCPKRLTPCEFCKLEVPLDELQKHASVCGSRTEKCFICKKHIMLKDLEEHPNSCKKKDAVELDCEYCGLKISSTNFKNHASTCENLKMFEKDIQEEEIYCDFCGFKVPVKCFTDHASVCKDRELWGKSFEEMEITCEFCKFKISSNVYKEHVIICGTQKVQCLVCDEPIMAQDKVKHLEICGKVSFSRQKMLCKYCDKSFSEDYFKDHVVSCGSRTEKCEKCNKYVLLKDKEMHPPFCKMVSKNQGNCRYCRASVSWIDMNVHEAACALEDSEDNDYAQQNMLNELSLKENSPFKKDTRNDEMSCQVYKKVCLYCNETFPQLHFPKHLEHCKERPYNCSECLKAMPYKEKEKHTRFQCHGEKDHIKVLPLHEVDKFTVKDNLQIQKYKKCQFCNERLPDLIFENHIQACSKWHEKCKFCNASVLHEEMKNHQMFSCSVTKNNDNRYPSCEKYLYAENMPSSNNSEIMKYLEENIEICPSCKCKIPFVRFAHHVQYCLEGMKPCKFCGLNIEKKNERNHLENCKKLLDAGKDFASQSNEDNIRYERKSYTESLFGRWFGNKEKKEESMAQIQHKYTSEGGKNGRKDSIMPRQPLQSVIPLVPCEFCDDLYPFETLIEHQSGCRPDLVSFPKKEENETVDLYVQEDDKSSGSYKSIASRNSKNMFSEWTEVPSRRSRKASIKRNADVEHEGTESPSGRRKQLSTEWGDFSESFIQHKKNINIDKNFYYSPSGCAKTELNCVAKNKEKLFSELAQNGETSKIDDSIEIDSEKLSRSFMPKDNFTLFKFSSSASMEENNSSLKPFGSSTNVLNLHQMKKNDSNCYQVFPALPNDEKSILSKVVGAERAEKGGVFCKTKEVSSGLTYNENLEDYLRAEQVPSYDNTIGRNLAMETVWNTDCNIKDNCKELVDNNHEIKAVHNPLSNVEKVLNMDEDRIHTNNETITNEQKTNFDDDPEMIAYFKYLSCRNDGCFNIKKEKTQEEKLASDSTASCDCGNQICYCAIARESSLTENAFSRENSHLKDNSIALVQDTLCNNQDPKPMEVD
ncbi:TRAF-type zinc finger domain-containing protein 1 [Nephila pilipes]|uniref:TRAF-type zinc finger domain-containing protein 1 n=1 Tax=Nephila pilipes TaxID=299642 RepID=A0A8X6P9G5_NEPPI|nr:TRAF-type zinc finger domain-containing protein 1 [Nephila pilipes]